MTATEPITTSASPTIDWAEALRLHERWLRTVVVARLRERHAIDEVMQEIHLATVCQRTPLSEVREVGAWLYRLALRQASLYRRKMGRQASLVDRYARQVESRSDATSSPDPLAWLLADERSRLVREALAHLPGRDAEILLLKYTEQWSYRELSERLGLSESAVESRLQRARTRLRAALRPHQSD